MDFLRKEIYSLIRSQEDVFDFIQDFGLDGFWYCEVENIENQWINPKFWNGLGYSVPEISQFGKGFQSVAFQEDIEELISGALNHFQFSDAVFNQYIRFIEKSQQTVLMFCHVKCVRDNSGKPVRFLCGLVKNQIQNSDAESKFYKSVLNSQSIYINRIDGEGIYTYVNDYFCEAFGYG
ncbi:MAG: PAS domain-containing protein, partial [Dyadobacter sp.]